MVLPNLFVINIDNMAVGLDQPKSSDVIVWDGKIKQGRDRGQTWVKRQIFHRCIVSPCLTPAGQFKGERTRYRPLTSVCGMRRRRKWLLMQSRSHLHPVVHPHWVQNIMLHHSLSLLQCLKCLEHNGTNYCLHSHHIPPPPPPILFFFCFSGGKTIKPTHVN